MGDRRVRTDDRQTSIYVVGAGGVGGALLGQLAAAGSRPVEGGPRLVVAGVANSRRMHLEPDGLDAARGRSLLDDGTPVDLGGLSQAVASTPGAVVVDVTASAELPEHYPRWLEAGAAVVTANKLGLCGSIASFRDLKGQRLYYETTAGAGLPVVETVRSLVTTGDRILGIEGVFSGTLGYIFHELSKGVGFSAAVADAAARGYTEPDPNEDLSGLDVARKLVILARTASFALELGDVEVESLVDRGAELERLRREGQASGRHLAYLAIFREGRARVGVESVEPGHPAARLTGTDNLFLLETERYGGSPIVVQGSGAGPAVTAGGVFADILRACAETP